MTGGPRKAPAGGSAWAPRRRPRTRPFLAAEAALVVLLALGAACTPPWVNRLTVNIVPEVGGEFRIDVALAADRKYPDCRILADGVRATVDGVEMRSQGTGRSPSGEMISGVKIPPLKECDGWAGFTTFSPLTSMPDGTATTILIDDGSHRLEVSVMNARARFRTELVGGPDVVVGDTVTLSITPERDPAFERPPGGQINIYTPSTRVAMLQGDDVRVSGRHVLFKLPALPPGQYTVIYNGQTPPLSVLACRGAPACAATRLLAPDSDVVLKVH